MRRSFGLASTALLYFALASAPLAQTTGTPPKAQGSQSQDSLADAARKNRPKDAQVASKRTWTDDDFEHTGDKGSSASALRGMTPEGAAEAVRKFRSLDQQEIGAAVLKQANAPDVSFPDRKNWEQSLFEAKQAWVDQVARMDGHRDAAKDARDEELRLAIGAQRNFYRIADEGIEKARAVNDPILKAHLEYKRRLDSCRAMSGDLRQSCVEAADRFMWQMQRDGSW